ncbi:MAG: DMT family transporter [Cyanobacteria bacterium J06650_10]
MSRPTLPKNATSSKLLLGTVLVLLSAVFLAMQNVISRLFFVPSSLFGYFQMGGWLTSQFSNIVMLLSLRMGLMAVLLAIAAPRLYPNTFGAIGRLTRHTQLLGYAVGSGTCLFVGLTALYFSLSQVVAGVAIATFFIYPAITLLLAWHFLQQRPRIYQLSLMLLIFCGVVLTAFGTTTTTAIPSNPTLGILSGLVAGLSFGVYGIFAEIVLQPSKVQSKQQRQSSQTLHPVPFSLVTFVIVSALGSVSLLFMPAIEVAASAWKSVLLTTLFSALITVTAYVLNNFGIQLIGASLTALISASAPALTALFAWVALQESLRSQQILGVAIVTAGVAALSIKSKTKRSD